MKSGHNIFLWLAPLLVVAGLFFIVHPAKADVCIDSMGTCTAVPGVLGCLGGTTKIAGITDPNDCQTKGCCYTTPTTGAANCTENIPQGSCLARGNHFQSGICGLVPACTGTPTGSGNASIACIDTLGNCSLPIGATCAPGTTTVSGIAGCDDGNKTGSCTRSSGCSMQVKKIICLRDSGTFTENGICPAATGSGTTTPPSSTSTSGTGSIKIFNPISCGDARCLVVTVIKYILGTVSLLATFMFIWGGIMMISAGGNADTIKKAKETLTWATIGIIVTLMSYEMILFIINGLNNANP